MMGSLIVKGNTPQHTNNWSCTHHVCLANNLVGINNMMSRVSSDLNIVISVSVHTSNTRAKDFLADAIGGRRRKE